MGDFIDDHMAKIFGAVLVIILGLLIWACVVGSKEHDQWVSWCQEAGGHVDSSTQTSTGTTFVNGKVGTTTSTSTTYYCLSPEGGVLGVE